MRRWHIGASFGGALAAAMILSFFVSGAAAQYLPPYLQYLQYLRLGEWGGYIETETQYGHLDTKSGGAISSRQRDVISEERFSLRNNGAYIYDPDLINFSIGTTFGFSQRRLTFDGRTDSRNGTILGYNFFTAILPNRPLSLNLFARRDQTRLAGQLAGRSDTVSEAQGGTLFAPRLYIPSTLTFRHEVRDDESRVSGFVAQRKDRRNVLTYLGQRGWTDSEMSVAYEFVDLADEVFPNVNYQSHEGKHYYSLDFGPELNRRWDSRLRLFTRTGIAELTNFDLNESVRIQHTSRLQTDYAYGFNFSDTGGGDTTSHRGAIHLGHRLYESLRTDLRFNATFKSFPSGRQNIYGGRGDFAYTKRIPWDGTLNAGLGAGTEYNSRRVQGTETFVPQESHTAATPFALAMPLGNPFVITSTVVVTKIAVGPLPPGCLPPPGPPTPLALGQDYTLQTFGDITEVVPIPCSGTIPGINPGDTIAVDYRFSVSPSLAFLTTSWHFNLGLNYKWIRPYFIHEQTDQNLISGRDGRFLDDRMSDTLGAELRYQGRRLRASLLGEGRHFSSHRNPYDSIRLNQYVGFNILPELILNLNAQQAFFSYSRPRRETQTFTERITLTYALGGNLFADASAGASLLRQSFVPSERTIDAGLRVRWLYRSIEVLPSLEFSDRQRGDADTKQFRLTLRLTRRF